MKTIFLTTLVSLFLFSCEKSQEEILNDYNNVMTLKVENDNAYADNFNKIKIIAEFPNDFITEDDGKVDFYISKDTEEHKLESIRLIQENGVSKKIAEAFITHNKNELLNVRAVVTINGVETSKQTSVTFKKAYFDELNIIASSLVVTHNTFNTIQLTTELNRNNGVVTLNSIAETVIKDSSGNTIGIFNNYKNKTDSTGKIVNNFAMGNNNYIGILYAITSSANELGVTQKDTLILYSN
ncbi:MAG: hypothetical protein J0L86_05360 [Flavobacteriales bacterium]|nr:hypothetical protein [Flavobacteriales bacterium]